jgi:hypothetical protein
MSPLFERFLVQIGRLNYVWTNTESVLIHFIAGLLETDKARAVIVFLTLNTTRARIDLVDRLAKARGGPAGERDAILECTAELLRISRIRNLFNHCIYSFDPERGSVQTILMRIADRKSDIRMGLTEEVDEDRIRAIDEAIDDLGKLNRKMWEHVKRRGYPL